jgi:hypothetical protein
MIDGLRVGGNGVGYDKFEAWPNAGRAPVQKGLFSLVLGDATPTPKISTVTYKFLERKRSG